MSNVTDYEFNSYKQEITALIADVYCRLYEEKKSRYNYMCRTNAQIQALKEGRFNDFDRLNSYDSRRNGSDCVSFSGCLRCSKNGKGV